MAEGSDYAIWALLGLGIAGIIAVIIWMGVKPPNKDDGAQIKVFLGIIGLVTGIIILILGAAAYMYFTANINYMPSFLFIMSFLNMFLSVFAVSAASLQVSSA